MKNLIAVVFVFFLLFCKAQVFNGVGGAIRNDGQDSYFNTSVTGLSSSQLNSSYGIEEIRLTINHPAIQELYIYLQSPDGKKVELAPGSSCYGVNYTNTCFNSKSSSSVTLGNPPYTGTYRPTGYLGRFNNGQNGNGNWKLIVHDYLAFVNSGNLISWSIKFGNDPAQAVAFSSSNLPIVIINTNYTPIGDTEIPADLGIIDNGIGQRNNITDPKNNYNGKSMIHLHGSSSKNFEKKSFTIETRDGSGGTPFDVPILGMPEESDWFLLASYTDKTLIRNPISYEIFRKMGHYSPRYRYVEVVLNGEYQGIYALVEKPKRGKNRISVSKLTDMDNSNPDVTGGYIIKIDRTDADGWYSSFGGNSTNSKFYYQYVYPKDTAITPQQKTYISNYMHEFETAMNSSNYANVNTGYPKYINEISFIDFLIINELSKNVDAYRLSTYLHKDKITKDGKLYAGPAWDYDIAWHNCNYGNTFDPAYWQFEQPDTTHPCPTWWGRFMQDPNFKDKLYCRWKELRQNILSANNLYSYIDNIKNELNESQQRNFTQWPILGAYIFPNPQGQINTNYQNEVNDLKNWISNRLAWLDANITGTCTNVAVADNRSPELFLEAYPNPFTNRVKINFSIPGNGITKLELINIIGEQVSLLPEENKSKGIYEVNMEVPQLSAGVYFVKMSFNNRISYKKVVKLIE